MNEATNQPKGQPGPRYMTEPQRWAIWQLSKCRMQPDSWDANFLCSLWHLRKHRTPLTKKQAAWLGRLRFRYRAQIKAYNAPEALAVRDRQARLDRWHARNTLYSAFGGR